MPKAPSNIPRPSAGFSRIRFKGSVTAGLSPWRHLSSFAEPPSVRSDQHHEMRIVKVAPRQSEIMNACRQYGR
ncbi:hypothetical protein SAMN02746095_02365 [Acidocella aminolytica 101 = DSM 11237]|nr:hypothetical protein SAMN02746095_02365 [Acidocella aminolytica 101 = DSM 11237]